MIREKLIRIDLKGREHLKENVLFWNEQTKAYYCMTPDVLLGRQNARINSLEKTFEETKKAYEDECRRLKEFYEGEMAEMKQAFQNQLAQQKEINARLITMVEEFIKGGN